MKFEFYYKFNKNFELISYSNSVYNGSKSQCIEYNLNKERISVYQDNYSIDLATNIIDSYYIELDYDRIYNIIKNQDKTKLKNNSIFYKPLKSTPSGCRSSIKLAPDVNNSGFQLMIANTEILKKLLNIAKESGINKWLFKKYEKNLYDSFIVYIYIYDNKIMKYCLLFCGEIK